MGPEIDRLIARWDLVPPVPRSAPEAGRRPAPRLETLDGAAGAFFDNSKDNAAGLLQEVARLLQEEHRAAAPTFLSKPLHTRVADPSQIDEAARRDYGVVAIGD